MPQQPLAQVPGDAVWNWQEEGACRTYDPLIFFHPQNERGSARSKRDHQAKMICAGCQVRLECADYAIRAREPFGVWGGLTEEERERVYARLDSKHHPRERGSGLRAAGREINEAISPRALGITA
jgi:WhiB family transcriptional regulator, redox-sensing transcriptional regulator